MSFRIRHGILMDYRPEPGETEVVIPESVTKIEKCAFQGCRKLRSIAIPREVMTIGEGVFADCESFDTIFLQNIAINMDEDAFISGNTLTFEFI